MTVAQDLATGQDVLDVSRRRTEAAGMLAASILTLGFVASLVDEATDQAVAGFLWGGSNQSEFLVPNGGWLTSINACPVGNDTWTTGDVTVRVMVTRVTGEDPEELELAAFEFEPGDEQQLSFERVLLHPGDKLYVQLAIDDANTLDDDVFAAVTVGLGLFRG